MKKRILNDFVYFASALYIVAVPALSGLYSFIHHQDQFVNLAYQLPFFVNLGLLIPYGISFYYRKDDTIHPISRGLACLVAPMALLSLFKDNLDFDFVFAPFWFGAGLYLAFYWDGNFGIHNKDEYAFYLDPKRTKKIPSKVLHENLQVVGNTGAGKTHHVLKPLMYQTIQQGLGLFAVDVKSNLVRDIVYYANKCSRRHHLNYLDLGRPDLSMSCNPLAGGTADEIASRVFTALYYDTTNDEPHYVRIANGFLQDLIFLLKLEIPIITFQDLATAVGETDTFRTIAALCVKHSKTEQAKNFQPWLRKSPQQRQDELAGLILKLRRFCNREWSPLINSKNPKFTMKKIIERNEIFLLGLASAKYPDDTKPLAILFMMALQSEVAERYMNPPEKPFRVVLDEFYNLAYPGFIDLINKCRDARVNLVLAHQSNGDLSGVSQEFKEQVMNTANNKIVLRVSDPATAEYFSSLFGTEVFRKQGSTSYDAGGNERGHSDRDARKFRIHPDDIKELPVGQAVVRVCHPERVECFKTALGTAPQPPADFELGLTHIPVRERENHSSLEAIFKDEPPKGRKKGLDLGLQFGEGDNA